ncbi:hypothetical protein F2Q68_00025411 [Brassica cretica]|uniref:Uncharacterized protein n=2 Tax=Brassica cretica TaxID=69181 RepID=A0A8S9IIP2_BRACR|nr:hypothetical protein F2Q68_00025411 [Brassica cretica]KAF3581404.1 hypothetical protein DY000_02031254 [Brassica cretica]
MASDLTNLFPISVNEGGALGVKSGGSGVDNGGRAQWRRLKKLYCGGLGVKKGVWWRLKKNVV